MSITITVDGKVAGRKRPLLSDWRIDLPPLSEAGGDRLRLRDLITSVVAKEVEAFQARQADRKLARIMSRERIEAEAAAGKVDPGTNELERQAVSVDEASATALQAYVDGLYYVFVDGVQQSDLDGEVYLKPQSRVLFLRLVALAGG